MTELTDLNDTDALNTAVTGNSTEGNVANMGNMDNLQQAILGMLSRFRNANIFRLRDNTDNTKLLAFGLSGLTTATTRTLTVPDANGVLALTSNLRGHLYGLTLTNNGTDANNDIDIAAGAAASEASAPVLMTLASAITKRLDAAWAVGTGNGGLDTGSKANSTWYHVYLIQRSDTGVVDALFSTSSSSPTLPTNYDRQRRIGAVQTNGSGNIYSFFQTGDYFQWGTARNDIATGVLGTTAVTFPISVPSGARYVADIEGIMTDADEQASIWISSPLETDTAPGTTLPTTATLSAAPGNFATFGKRILTDTSSQIRCRSNVTNTTIRIRTAGYTDPRGRT